MEVNVKRLIIAAALMLPLSALSGKATFAAPNNSHTVPVTLTCENGDLIINATLNGGYIYHGVDTTGNYIIKYISSPETGVVRDIAGFSHNGLRTITCNYIGPSSGNHYTVTVLATPASK